MQMQIKGVIPHGSRLALVELYGHTSKGMAGVEIIGLGQLGRVIKEKLLYISKSMRLKLPLRRFTLCVELACEVKEYRNSSLRYLELPLLILFWSLAGTIPITRLEECFSMGMVSPTGDITQLRLLQEDFSQLAPGHRGEIGELDKYIGISGEQLPLGVYYLPLDELLPRGNRERILNLVDWRGDRYGQKLKAVAE